MNTVFVLDATGQPLSPTTSEKARQLLALGKAKLVCQEPLTIQLPYTVELPVQEEPARASGSPILLHTCCAPCTTYTQKRLREEGFEVTGFWYNPNVHPFTEHQRRRESLEYFADVVRLSLITWDGYDMPRYLRAVVGHEPKGRRCEICYRLRLGKTAEIARQQGFELITTTLLISPYQDQDLIRGVGQEMAQEHGVEFYFENFRRGWGERGRMTRDYGLYRQQYCGCVYSEWERYGEKGTERMEGEAVEGAL